MKRAFSQSYAVITPVNMGPQGGKNYAIEMGQQYYLFYLSLLNIVFEMNSISHAPTKSKMIAAIKEYLKVAFGNGTNSKVSFQSREYSDAKNNVEAWGENNY